MWTLLLGLASGQAARSAQNFARRAALTALAGLLALIGAGFLVGAAFLAVLPHLGAIPTALLFGGVFLVIALIVWASARHRPQPALTTPLAGLETEAAQAMAAVPSAVAKAPGLSLMTAFAGGLILAMKLRK